MTQNAALIRPATRNTGLLHNVVDTMTAGLDRLNAAIQVANAHDRKRKPLASDLRTLGIID